MKTIIAALSCWALVAACAHRSGAPQTPTVIHRIALIPASNPTWYSFENGSPAGFIPGIGLPVWVGYKASNHHKYYRFNEVMTNTPMTLGDQLTRDVVHTLEERGFTVEVITDVLRSPKDPDDIDEDTINRRTDADAIVHLRFYEVGVYAGHLSATYLPRVNAGGEIWVRHHEERLATSDFYYGVDAKKDKQWAIASDAKYQWKTFDDVMNNLDSVRGAFTDGTDLIAAKIGDQIASAALQTNPQVSPTASADATH